MKMNYLMCLGLCVVMAAFGCKRDGAQQNDETAGADSTGVRTSISTAPNPEGGPEFTPADPSGFDQAKPRMVARSAAESPAEGDGYLETAIRKQFTAEELSEMTDDDKRYGYSKIDLNQDGTLEYLVGLTGPRFCKEGMCTVMVFQEVSPKKFQQIGKLDGAVMPFFVYEKDRRNKWSYLVAQDKLGDFHMYSFNGTQYEADPRKMTGEQEVVVSLTNAWGSALRFFK